MIVSAGVETQIIGKCENALIDVLTNIGCQCALINGTRWVVLDKDGNEVRFVTQFDRHQSHRYAQRFARLYLYQACRDKCCNATS